MNVYYLGLAIGFSLSILGLISVIFSKKNNSTHFYMSNTEHLDPKIVKVINLLGGDLLSLLPKKTQKRSISSKEIDDVFRGSGNPWGVTKMEFLALRVAYGFVYAIGGVLFVTIIRPTLFLSVGIILALTFLGWNKPISTYRKIGKVRAKDFQKNFPEMLDYLTMIMSDGTYTFANAIEAVIPYLPPSAVKDEFTIVTDSINAGMDTEAALKALAGRLPSPALEAFVNAVNNANTLNTPMDGLMRTRAQKSREDLMTELEMIIQSLPTKTMLTVAPAAIASMLAIFMVPVIMALLETL